jgi:hypothetical protein
MPRIFTHGQKLCADLASALNITRPVRSILVEANCSKAASVTVEFVPDEDDSQAVAMVLRKYGLLNGQDA